MTVDRNAQIFCRGCQRTKRADQFYSSNNLTKYPNGKIDLCKDCATLEIDNWKPETYLGILKECDVPYVPKEWNKLLASYGKDPTKVSGKTIIGRYIGKMKLVQFEKFRWDDTEFLQQVAEKETEEAMKRQGYSASEIAKKIMDDKIDLSEDRVKLPDTSSVNSYLEPPVVAPPEPQTAEDYFAKAYEDLGIENDLTDEDKRYLLLKWGKTYRPDEWVKLEDLYTKMTKSYDIQGAGHEDTLILVCKTSLKANQLLDIGDMDGAQKATKMYDSLMKSGKFTALQNKKDDNELLDSVSELVSLCETEGFIPRFYTSGPQDKVDETLLDMKNYVHDLVVGEMNLGNLIENAVRQMTELESKEEDEDIDEDISFEDLDSLKEQELTDQDFFDFNNFEESEREEDEKYLKGVR